MKSQTIIRLAKHAGSWYSQNHSKLDQQLSTYLSSAQKNIKTESMKVKAIIGPHAGYRYSGAVAAWSYSYLQNQQNQKLTIFLLGPSHYKYFKGISISGCQELETPLGNLEVDIKTVQKLKSQIKCHLLTKKEEEKQHSLEMHLPYIKKIFGVKAKIVPIIVGEVNQQIVNKFGQTLSSYFDDENTLFIVSSDFCHWGQNFEYQPYNEKQGQIWKFIQNLDRKGMKLIEEHDGKGFQQYIKQTNNTICGQNPIKLMLGTLKYSKFKHKTQFVKYDQSQKVKKSNQCSVSYATSITYRV